MLHSTFRRWHSQLPRLSISLMGTSTSLAHSTSTGALGCVWPKTWTLFTDWPGLTSHQPTYSVLCCFHTGWADSTDFTESFADRLASKCFGNLFCSLSAACRQLHFNFSSASTSTQRTFSRSTPYPIGGSPTTRAMNALLAPIFHGPSSQLLSSP